TTAGL
ncbi:hypothetical protein YQE_04144, partial [Dendroctonus ponderosae]